MSWYETSAEEKIFFLSDAFYIRESCLQGNISLHSSTTRFIPSPSSDVDMRTHGEAGTWCSQVLTESISTGFREGSWSGGREPWCFPFVEQEHPHLLPSLLKRLKEIL